LCIESGRAERHYWRDLWRYRELFLILAWRDVAIRYKQTVAGAAWAVLQPLLTLVVMTLIFGKFAGLHSPGKEPDSIVVCAGMLPWFFFSSGLSSASQSLVTNANLISKVYFPRLIIPASSLVVSFIDFLVSGLILAGLMVWHQYWPTWRFLALPPLMLLAVVASLGPSLIITALIVRFRDFRFLIPFIVQFGMLLSPVGYPTQVVRDHLGEGGVMIYSLNPMVGVIDGFRWAILGHGEVYWPGFLISLALAGLLLAWGVLYFRRTERVFADII